MLAHGFPMIVLWGEQLVQLYNDGYAEILADKHPGGLGQPTRECWPEVWHINGPIYQRVWQGETITYEDKLYPLARRGRLEDVWFTITYSPIRGEEGRINGVLVTMFETTAAHVAQAAREREEQKRRESDRRLALAFKVLPVGSALSTPKAACNCPTTGCGPICPPARCRTPITPTTTAGRDGTPTARASSPMISPSPAPCGDGGPWPGVPVHP